MTEGSDAETEVNGAATGAEEDAPAAVAPLSATEWRTAFAGLPTREIWRVLQKEKTSEARIFAGFRPAPEMLRSHPVVVTRLVDEAVKFPAFAKAVREILPTPASSDDTAAAAAPDAPAAPNAPPEKAPKPFAAVKQSAEPKPDADEKTKEQLKALRDVQRENAARIKALETQIAQAERDREAAKAEAAAHQAARREAEAQARRTEAEAAREKRAREKERAALAKEHAAALKSAQKTKTAAAVDAASPVSVLPSAAAGTLLFEAAERLLQSGRFASVADLCRETLLLGSGNAGERGRVHALYASAWYGVGNGANGEQHDRLAALAFLDGGDAVHAAESLARLATHQTGTVRPGNVPLLRRLAALAQKTNQTDAVRTVLEQTRFAAPHAYRKLRDAAGSGGTTAAVLFGGTASSASPPAIGPDEPVSLPAPHGAAMTAVTPRQLVRAVNGGEADYVFRVRAALYALRQQSKPSALLADALLEAVGELSPVAVCPLLRDTTRPVLVDASNVARYNPDPLALETPPRVHNLRLMRDYLLRHGFFPVSLIADANLRFHVDDKAAYLELVREHIVRETPPGTSADETLLQEARDKSAALITNDHFNDWGEAARRIERVGFLITASGISLTPF